MLFISEKLCQECGSPFKGRKDKKFCSDPCRTEFNNRLNSDEINYIRNVNNVLRKNRRILRDLNPDGKIRVHYEKLRSKGFDFTHFTSMQHTRDGSHYYYCYDHGYRIVEKDFYLLVIRKD